VIFKGVCTVRDLRKAIEGYDEKMPVIGQVVGADASMWVGLSASVGLTHDKKDRPVLTVMLAADAVGSLPESAHTPPYSRRRR
jgi:hypothetical protein